MAAKNQLGNFQSPGTCLSQLAKTKVWQIQSLDRGCISPFRMVLCMHPPGKASTVFSLGRRQEGRGPMAAWSLDPMNALSRSHHLMKVLVCTAAMLATMSLNKSTAGTMTHNAVLQSEVWFCDGIMAWHLGMFCLSLLIAWKAHPNHCFFKHWEFYYKNGSTLEPKLPIYKYFPFGDTSLEPRATFGSSEPTIYLSILLSNLRDWLRILAIILKCF